MTGRELGTGGSGSSGRHNCCWGVRVLLLLLVVVREDGSGKGKVVSVAVEERCWQEWKGRTLLVVVVEEELVDVVGSFWKGRMSVVVVREGVGNDGEGGC